MLNWQHSYMKIFNRTYKPTKLDHRQTVLVLGLWSEFFSRFVHAGLEDSTYGRQLYDLGNTLTAFDRLYY